MLTIIENAKYSKKPAIVYLCKSKYTKSEDLISELSKELKIDEKKVHLLTRFQGKFEKVQHLIIKDSQQFPKKIRIPYAYLNLLNHQYPEEIISFKGIINLPMSLTETEKNALNYAINYFVDEYKDRYVSSAVLFKFDSSIEKFVEGIFRCVVRDFYKKGKSKDLLIKSIVQKDTSKLDVIKKDFFRKAATALIENDPIKAIHHLPKDLVRKYVSFYFKKIWNREVSNVLKKVVPQEFLLENVLVLFLKTYVPFIHSEDYVTIDLRSNNNLFDSELEKSREKYKDFLNLFSQYFDNFQRKILLRYISLEVEENKIVYETKTEDNFMVAKSLLLIKEKKEKDEQL
ncbi:MAG: hypothetical protein QXD62_00295 [Candidatus Woesearchaeota archaeon]